MKQTHVINSIITQKISEENYRVGNNATIRKSQRSVNVPDSNILPYTTGAKKTPKFLESLPDEQTQSLSTCQLNERAEIIDLTYALIKYTKSDDILLPGWTGFNTMLYQNDVPEESRVG